MFAALAGIIAGFLHVVVGPDHLAALAPIALDDQRRAARVGASWGLGHGVGVVALGLIGIATRRFLDLEGISAFAELVVGVLLIVVGLWSLRRAARIVVHDHAHDHAPGPVEEHAHVHVHVHVRQERHDQAAHQGHSHAAFGIGLLHGTAGGGHLFGVVPALALPTGSAIVYLAGYLVAAVAAMVVFGLVLGRLASLGGPRLLRGLLTGTGSVAVVLGVVWITMAWP